MLHWVYYDNHVNDGEKWHHVHQSIVKQWNTLKLHLLPFPESQSQSQRVSKHRLRSADIHKSYNFSEEILQIARGGFFLNTTDINLAGYGKENILVFISHSEDIHLSVLM